MSSRAIMYYDTQTNKWVFRGKGGANVFEIPDGNKLVTKFMGFVATLVANTAIGSGFSPGVGTLQSATGSGVGCSEIVVGDMVFGNPKIALGAVGITGFHVPTTGRLNVYLTGNTVAGTLAAGCGFDIFAIRTA